jgi:hypothetical protein
MKKPRRTAPSLPADLRPMIDAVIRTAKAKLEAGDEIPGVAFVDTMRSDERFVALPMSGFPTKDLWAGAVRFVSSQSDARFVIVMSEVWTASVERGDTATIARLNREGVASQPGRQEMMLVQIETHEGLWCGLAPLKPFMGPGLRPGKTFDPPDLEAPLHGEGRLGGLLGRRPGRKNN